MSKGYMSKGYEGYRPYLEAARMAAPYVKRAYNAFGSWNIPKGTRLVRGGRTRKRFARNIAMGRKRAAKKRKRRSTKCKVTKLCKFMKQSTAIHERRNRTSGHQNCATGTACVFELDEGGTVTDIEAAMSSLRFYDPGTNALVTNDPSLGTYSRDINVRIVRILTLKNNFQVPCTLKVYSCVPKDATEKGALDYFTSGLLDQGNPSSSSPLVQVKDSRDLRNVWTVKLVGKRTLQPGQSMTCKSFTKNFDFNMATVDAHTLAHQKHQGGHNWLYRLSGVLGHSPTIAGEQGIVRSGIDYLHDVYYTFKYDAGKDLHDISVVDTSTQTFTDSPVTGLQPVTDNQAYDAT